MEGKSDDTGADFDMVPHMLELLIGNEQLRTFAADMYSQDESSPFTEAEIECIRRGTVPPALRRKIARNFTQKMPMVLPLVSTMMQSGGTGGLGALLTGIGGSAPSSTE